MDRVLFIAMSGAREALANHGAQSHNLANSQTTGFRADLMAAKSLPVYGPGHEDRAYAQLRTARIPDLTPGSLISTGRELDVAIEGEGFMVIQTQDGAEALSRAGNLRIDTAGLLTDVSGRSIMGESGPIALPAFDALEIGSDGTISIRPPGQTEGPLAVVDRILMAKPEPTNLYKAEDGTIRLRDGSPAVPDASVTLVAGSLETSNVNSIGSMVNMIEMQRQFETHVRLMRTTEENDQAAARLLRLRG